MRNKLFILCIIICLVFITSCTKNKKTLTIDEVQSKITTSMNSVKEVKTKMTFKDTNVVVYEYERNVILSENEAKVTTSTSEYNDKFEYVTTSKDETIEDFNRSLMFKVTINSSFIKDVKITSDKTKTQVKFNVTKENIPNVLHTSKLKVDSDASITIDFENDKIVNFTCLYTSTGKTVEIVTGYVY